MASGRLLSASDVTHCPHRVALDRGAEIAVVEVEHSTEVRRRIREGASHRERIIAAITALYPEAEVADDYAATEEAMGRRVPVILRARLADSGTPRRFSSVDILVRTTPAGSPPRYAPIIVKNNEAVGPAATRRMLQGSLESLSPYDAGWVGGVGARRNDPMVRNGMTLAHALRVLGAFGVADEHLYGGIVDRQGRLWWIAFGDPDNEWRMTDYDEAHRQRLEIVLAHERWRRGEGAFPTEPFWHRECPECPYTDRCRSELEKTDDVSLVRFTSRPQQTLLREHGVRTRRDLAALDPQVAAIARERLLVRESDMGPEAHLGGEIERLDELIYRARSVVAHSPLRKLPAGTLACPTADVEVDVDMESYNEITYLWGALVTTRREIPGCESGYRSFSSWDPLTGGVEAEVFSHFWRWFCGVRQRALESGATFAAYCFWAQAENYAMNRAAAYDPLRSPTPEELDAFRRRPTEWIDLHDVVRDQIQTDGPLGLKALAKAAGFEWRDENPSGEASMTWYESAVSPVANEDARRRILEYNEDDCRATRALRVWMNGAANDLPSRDDRP